MRPEIINYGDLSGYELNINNTEAVEAGGNLEETFEKQYNLNWNRNKVK